MIEINIEIYVYALFLLIRSTTSSLVITIHSLSDRGFNIIKLTTDKF